MKLHFKKFGQGTPLIIMHGVFGSSDNWQTLGKEFAEKYTVYLVDLRNHGKSPHSERFDYQVMASDVIETMDAEGIDQAHLLGHSMGGKVAMTIATSYAERVKKLIVVDIAPKAYPPHHQQIFEGFNSVNLDSIQSRKEADEQLSQVISNIGIRQFILKNLSRNERKQFIWQLNLEVIEKKINEVGAPLEDGASFLGDTLFIKGGASDYIKDSDTDLINSIFNHAKITTIERAGHWVHAEQPKALKDAVMAFLA